MPISRHTTKQCSRTLVADHQDARLSIFGDGGTLIGGTGHDTLYASGSRNILQAGSGTDGLHTGGVDNVYEVGSDRPVAVSTEIRQDAVGATGMLQLLTPVAPAKLWFGKDAPSGLVIRLLGTTKSVTIDNWFSAVPTQ